MDPIKNAEEVLKDKETSVLDSYDPLRDMYGDILRGFSVCLMGDEELYIKHFTDIDYGIISKLKTRLTQDFIKIGVPTKKERLDILKEGGEWTQFDEDKIVNAEFLIQDNAPALLKLIIPSQRKRVEEAITEAQREKQELLQKKANLVGVCAETKAEKITSNYFIFYSFFKDKDLKVPLWEKLPFDELEDLELIKYILAYNETLANFYDRNFRKIAVMPFVLNPVSYCKDQGFFFLGKAITQFTSYQISVFSKAMRNSFVLRESKASPPDINSDLKIQALLNWYDSEYSIVTSSNQETKGQSEHSTSKGTHKRFTM